MKGFLSVVGIVVVVVLLVTSGVVGGALCLKGVGCLSSKGDGAQLQSRQVVTVGTP
jgi:hypothetical protein